MGPAPLTAAEVASALRELPDWRRDGDALRAAFAFSTSAAAVAFLTAVAADAEAADHHPDVDWRYRDVALRSTTHCAGHRVTARDTALARRVSALAAAHGGSPAPAG